jgi:putative hydrolase of the HAD superfamily
LKKIGIIFDIDDTLITHSQAELVASQKFGLQHSEIIPDYHEDTFPYHWNDISQKCFNKFLEGQSSFEQQRIERIKTIFRNNKMTDIEAYDLFSDYLQLYEGSWDIYPDVLPFLEKCNKSFIPMGIISDGSQKQQSKKLEKTGILNFFNFVLTAEEMNCGKPDLRIFEKGLSLLSQEECEVYYIGDNIEKDAIGSQKAGLNGIWLNREKKQGNFIREISSLSQLSISEL